MARLIGAGRNAALPEHWAPFALVDEDASWREDRHGSFWHKVHRPVRSKRQGPLAA